MDNEHNNQQNPQDNTWLDEILGASKPEKEIGADEQAVSAAGLTHPDDLELERIMNEITQEASESEKAEEQVPVAQDAPTQQFAPPQEETPVAPPAPAQDAEPQTKPAHVRKGRPKSKQGYGLMGIPHILATLIWLLIIVTVGVSLGRMLWVCCADLMAFDKEEKKVVITVTEEDDISTISDKLGKAGLIRYPELFKLFAQLTGKDDNISAGTFTLNSLFDYNAMINAMGSHSPSREVVSIMFPEGYNCEQIFNLLASKGVCSVEDLEEYAANGKLDDYWFLEGVERGSKYCLEGYLFPDTYTFYTNDDPERVLEKFLDAFDNRFTDLMKSKLEPLNQHLASVLSSRGYGKDYIEEHKITIREIVIIASMIEKETSGDDESYTISSVIYNRLTNPGTYPHLNIDATLVYALGGNIDPETGKTKPLTEADKQMDHPYNTYVKTGLIPGPIANPGRNSIDAALDPADTRYYFYVFNPKAGEHIFAKTYAEHQNNVNYVDSLGN